MSHKKTTVQPPPPPPIQPLYGYIGEDRAYVAGRQLLDHGPRRTARFWLEYNDTLGVRMGYRVLNLGTADSWGRANHTEWALAGALYIASTGRVLFDGLRHDAPSTRAFLQATLQFLARYPDLTQADLWRLRRYTQDKVNALHGRIQAPLANDDIATLRMSSAELIPLLLAIDGRSPGPQALAPAEATTIDEDAETVRRRPMPRYKVGDQLTAEMDGGPTAPARVVKVERQTLELQLGDLIVAVFFCADGTWEEVGSRTKIILKPLKAPDRP